MKTRRHRWWIGSLGLLVLILLGTAPLQAAPPLQGPRWVPFSGTAAPAPPTLTLLDADAAQVDLAATLPGCTAADVTTSEGAFTRLAGDGYGHPADIGRPDLPVLRQDVEVPWGADVSAEIVAAVYRDTTLAELGLRAIYPLQPPLPKVDGAEDRSLSLDRAFYSAAGRALETPVRLGEPYTVRGHRVQPVEVWPVAYDARTGAVRLYSQVTFRLVLRGSDMARTAQLAARYASPVFEQGLAGRVLNYNQGRPAAPTAAVGYLIITADAYYDAMVPFAQLQQARGFAVTLTRLVDIPATTKEEIKAYIQEAYDTWPVPPAYVLLVGDTDTVPAWPSTQSSGKYTDLYYFTLDGSGDWHPDLGRGRFPVRSAAQTTIMVDKYLAYFGFTGQEPWLKKIAYIATCDQYQVAEGTHNYVINNYTLPQSYAGMFPNNPQPGGDQIYCITHGGSATNIRNAANDGRWALIYSGHGSETGWADGAVSFSQTDVRNLSDPGFYPFVASHACVTGTFIRDECYGETWVLQEDKGALVFWGASHNTFWGEDDILEKRMFDSLFSPGPEHPDVATMTDYGLAGVEASYPSSARYYWEAYNVLGDAAVRIFIEPERPGFALNASPAAHEVCISGAVTSSLVVGSLRGYSDTVYLAVAGTPAGITVTLTPTSAPAPFTSTLTIEVGSGAPAGDYTLLVTATDYVSLTRNTAVALWVRPGPPAAPVLTSPPDGASDQPLAPTMGWDASPYAGRYNLQVDYTPAFAVPLLDVSGLAHTSYTAPAPLEGGRCYWWRAQGENLCGAGVWAEPFHFSTAALGYAFYDDVEGGNQGWTAQSPWAITDEDAHSPDHSWTDSPGGSYLSNINTAITSPALDLSAHDSVALGFWHTYSTESGYDYCYVEYSTNGGSTWTTQYAYDGTGEWAYEEFSIPALAHQSNVRIRFRLQTDSSVTADGWHLDDIQLIVPLEPNPAPVVTGVTPNVGTPWNPTPVQIAGTGFVEVPSARLGSTWLLSVTLATSTTLDAVVPAGMAPGTYDLALYNGDCQEAVLLDAFHVMTSCVTPTVELAAGSPVELGAPMAFTATVGGTPPLTYNWDFGGPGYGVGLDTATPVYTYTAYGPFTVTAQVSNACGMDEAGIGVEVLCDTPAAAFDSDSPVELGAPMHFTSTVSGTGPLTYTWDFGDGVGASGDPHPVYTYTAAGDYTVTLMVEGPCGADAHSAVVQVLAGCEAPAAGFVSDSPIELGQTMLFTSTVSGTGPFTYTWDFGDGVGTSGEPNPSYAYTATGTFTVTLLVQGACGEDAASAAVTVLPGGETYWVYLPIAWRN